MTLENDIETKILEFIRSGEYDSIKIRFFNRRIHLIELEKREDVKKRIVTILKERKFQSLNISQHHGKITRITTVSRIKLGENGNIVE